MATTREAKSWSRKHPNFMTPSIVSMVKATDNLFIELSQGTGFDHGVLYGVTVIEYNPEKQEFDIYFDRELNKSFTDLNEARRYRENLLEQLEVKEIEA